MTISEFQRRLDRHGGALEDWPWLARLRARRLLARSPAARNALAATRAWEARLAAAWPRPEPTRLARLQAQLAAIPAHCAQARAANDAAPPAAVAPWLRHGAWLSAAATLLGFLAGMSGVLAPEMGVDWTLLAYGSY